jgi:hypothetical protein
MAAYIDFVPPGLGVDLGTLGQHLEEGLPSLADL